MSRQSSRQSHDRSTTKLTRRHDLDEHEDHHEVAWYKDADGRRFIGMFVMTTVYCIVEFIYGLKLQSLGLMADAIHMLSDVITLIIGYYAMLAARKDSTYSKTFGQKRMEIVASLVNATFMLSICLNMFMEAAEKFMKGYDDTNALVDGVNQLITVSTVGFFLNLLGAVLFGHDSHGHGHGDDEAAAAAAAAEEAVSGERGCFDRWMPNNVNIRGVLLHFLGDVLGSLAVVVSGLIIKYCNGGWRFYSDPVSALFIAIIIVWGTWPLVKQTSGILLQQTPAGIDLRHILHTLLKIEGVQEVHDLHAWTLADAKVVASMHVLVQDPKVFMKISDSIKLELHQAGIHSSTVQPEFVDGAEARRRSGLAHPCHEPVCSKSACMPNMCCPDRGQMIAKAA